MNTNKQVIAMVLLMFLGVAALGANAWFEAENRPTAVEEQAIKRAEQASHLFAQNCRVCHGNTGLGTLQAGLIGAPLNTPENTVDWRTDNAGGFQTIQLRMRDTIACGRNATAMPPWHLDQGGSLDNFKISLLVDLITTNAGNAWEEAGHLALEEDEQTIATLKDALAQARTGDDAEAIETAETALQDAEDRVERGLPIAQPQPTLTDGTCGQPVTPAGAGDSAPTVADTDVPEIDTSGFTADTARGEELFFANGCNACHGDAGEGNIGPKIAATALTFSQVVEQYRNPAALMPAFDAGTVPDADIFDIYSWLQTLE